jgi:starvation-inducible DNA-binding protein
MFWKRSVLNDNDAKTVAAALQQTLVDFIALSLQGKQAHWNLHGPQFLSVHEKLDEVVELARTASDEIAERMDQVGVAPDGRVKTVAETSRLEPYPPGFVPVERAVSLVADRLHAVAMSVRQAIGQTDPIDPLTSDLLTGLGEQLEKQLWMFQAVEKDR